MMQKYILLLLTELAKYISDVSVTTLVSVPPSLAAPTILYVSAGNTVAYIYYTHGTDTVTNYKYTTDGGTTFTLLTPASISNPLYIHGLTNGLTYAIQLEGYTDELSSSISNSLSVTPGEIHNYDDPLLYMSSYYTNLQNNEVPVFNVNFTSTFIAAVHGSVLSANDNNHSFNFIGGYILCNNQYNFTGNFALSVSVYPRNQAGMNTILANKSSNGGSGFAFGWNGTDNSLFLETTDNSSNTFISKSVSNVINLNTWQFVTVGFIQSENISLFYVNDLPVAVNSITTATNVNVNTSSFSVGAYLDGAHPMNGMIDRLGAWTVLCSAAMAQAIYNIW